MTGQSRIARVDSSVRNLGDLSGGNRRQESDGAIVAVKRVMNVERRAPTLREQLETSGELIDENIYDRKQGWAVAYRHACETRRLAREAR